MSSSQVPSFRRRSQSVSAEVAAYLEERITSGALRPGDRLPSERELAQTLSVSRASLREAMREMENKHLVERKPGRGTVISEQPHEVEELMRELAEGRQALRHVTELRRLVEPGIAGYAALRARPSNLLRLEDVLQRSNENLTSAESLRLDLEFHTLLAQAAQNPLLTTLLAMCGNWTEEVRRHSHATRKGRRASVEGHAAILRAVSAHDQAAAEAAMKQHLDEVRALIAERTGTEDDDEPS